MAPGSEAILLEPVNQPDRAPLPRSPTLEAQNGPSTTKRDFKAWKNAIFAIDDTPDDTAEQQLKDAIPKSEGDDRRRLKALLSAYSLFKNNTSHGIGHELFQCFTITDDSRDGVKKSKIDILRLDESATFSEFTQALSQCLSLECPSGLRVAVLCFEPMAKDKKGLFTTLDKAIATLRGRMRSLPLAPNNVIAFLLAQYLKDERPTLVVPTNPHMRDDRRRLLCPPSTSATRGNLDPRQLVDNQIVLSWQAEAPIFTTDFDVYIWEQYKSLPTSQRATVKLYPGSDTRETALLILFESSKSLAHFSTLRGDSQQQGSTSTITPAWSSTSEVLISLCAMYKVIIFETTTFLQGCSVELEKLHLAARQNPTADKIRYLVHLEDCCSSALEGMIHGLEVLECVAKWTNHQNILQPLWDAGKPFADRFAVLQQDLEFFRDHFSDMEKQVKELQQIIHDHLELTHNRRNFILTIVAAIYLPLSFATSFFGMNMNTTTSPGPQGFSNWTASWISNSPVGVQNSTKALVSTIASSGTQSYPWKTFIITALCLLLTLPLSLTIGGGLRLAYRMATYYVTYWRIIAILPSSSFISISICGLYFFPPIYWFYNAFLLAFLYGKTYQAWRSKQRRPVWTTMSAVTSTFFLLDYFTPLFPMMIVPWLYFLFIWFRPWYRRRRQEKSKSKVMDNPA